MSIMSAWGGWGGRFDQDLERKAQEILAGKKSSQDKVREFIERDLGVDPLSLPMKYEDACRFLQSCAQSYSFSAYRVSLAGNSLGLNKVVFVGQEWNSAKDEYEDDEQIVRDSDSQWGEYVRAWKSLCTKHPGCYSFNVPVNSYSDEKVEALSSVPETSDPLLIPVGAMARLRRCVLDGDDEYVYVRKGSLTSDSEICIMPGVEPMTDLAGWEVIEILTKE